MNTTYKGKTQISANPAGILTEKQQNAYNKHYSTSKGLSESKGFNLPYDLPVPNLPVAPPTERSENSDDVQEVYSSPPGKMLNTSAEQRNLSNS